MGKSYEAVHGVLAVLCLVLLVEKSGAYEFIVGGQKGWTVPSDPNFNPYNTWAEKSRFQIGDSLVFNYNSGQDSVLEVKSEDYSNCNTDAPIAKYTDGHTVYKFNHSGHHFFISGNRDNCLKNEKLVIVVLANRSSNNTQQAPTPAPSPLASSSTSAPSTPPSSATYPPSPPPSSAASPPSPPPSTASSPPAPSPTTGTTPTPAPVSGPPSHANGASSIFCTFAGTAGAFVVSTLILSF
ncbi:early nodulin-like protein 1 [Prosopis cineraria]|uniref:early nodulin-like protein 1 n=1 Tax=Prosopis cineraria TaxID=364024 RepID=UPI00241016C6|nr:early nodulin-like protein 1 [Prosopis cineraria]